MVIIIIIIYLIPSKNFVHVLLQMSMYFRDDCHYRATIGNMEEQIGDVGLW